MLLLWCVRLCAAGWARPPLSSSRHGFIPASRTELVAQHRPLSARSLLGKAAFKLGDLQQARAAYRAAIAANDSGPAGWMGLAELADATGDAQLAVEAYERLVRAAGWRTLNPFSEPSSCSVATVQPTCHCGESAKGWIYSARIRLHAQGTSSHAARVHAVRLDMHKAANCTHKEAPTCM